MKRTLTEREGFGFSRRRGTFPPRAVVGIEAEFTLYVDDAKRRPEEVFGTPARLVSQRMIPRIGRSFQLPSGGAIYFDTGVIEVATPIIELQPGCCYRVVRLLWEQIRYVRRQLDRWSRQNKRKVRLQGFSTHYNFSFPAGRHSRRRNPRTLGFLLAHLLPLPVALLAANRKSTAIGVRPRKDRIEVTADFTPDAALMLATCGYIAGVMETVLGWDDYGTRRISRAGLPRPVPFRLRKHSSRRGWRALARSLQHDPFKSDPNIGQWKLRDGRTVSLRRIAQESLPPFRRQIQRLGDRETLTHIQEVFDGTARSLLDFEERPPSYDDVGHRIDWNRRRVRRWSRSRYEKIIRRVITREPLYLSGKRYRVERMRGWYEVVFRESGSGRRRAFNLDELVQHAKTKPPPRKRPALKTRRATSTKPRKRSAAAKR